MPASTLAAGAAAAAVLAVAAGFPARWGARRIGWLDQPTGRKAHERPVPFGGGIVLVVAMLGGLCAARWLAPWTSETNALLFGQTTMTAALLTGLALSLALGAWDDWRPLSPWAKLAVQAGIGALMYAGGFRIERLTNPFGPAMEFGVPGWPITVAWYVALMNALNLIDGLDGLAAGVAAIAGLTVLGVSASWSQPSAALLSAIFVGACVGFLAHNFHPARLFLGDGGSQTLGFCLATLTLETGTKGSAMMAMLVALTLPLVDAVFAFVRRVALGRHPFMADQRHLHHRLLALGLSHRRVVLIVYYFSAVNGVLAYLLAKFPPIATAWVFLMLLVGFFLLIESLASIERAGK
ncbi:MAG: MraY family glycosyltransferase [Candidatus Sumerlaeota bacterium]|nr:MraY family glycosyltransferase [Candidatus Sumerlaeota bacterium]